MLVDSPLSMITLVPFSHTKDIFNAFAKRLSNFATYEREDRPIGNPEASEQEREVENEGRKTPRLALLLNALIILSTCGVERCTDTEVFKHLSLTLCMLVGPSKDSEGIRGPQGDLPRFQTPTISSHTLYEATW